MAENTDDLWKANHSSVGIVTAVLFIISVLLVYWFWYLRLDCLLY